MSDFPKRSILITLALPIYLPSILMMIGMSAVMLVIPLLAMELTNSYGAASLTFAMLGFGTLIADIPAGILVTRMGIRRSMILGILVTVSATFLVGLISSVIFLAVIGFFLGVGRGLNLLARITYITEQSAGERGRAMSAVGGTMRIGALIGPIMGGFLVKYAGYQVTMLVSSAIIATALAFLPFLKKTVNYDGVSHAKNPFRHVGAILTNYRSIFLTAGLAVIGLQLLRSARPLFIPLWGKEIGLDAAQIGLISGIPMALEMTMFYPVGTIMDKIGRKWTAVPCMLLLSLGLVLMPLCHSFKTFLLVALIAAVGNGLGSGIVLTLGADFSPENNRADFLGVWRLIGDIGHTTSPFLIGALTQAFALSVAASAAGGIGLVAALIMIFLVRETRRSVGEKA